MGSEMCIRDRVKPLFRIFELIINQSLSFQTSTKRCENNSSYSALKVVFFFLFCHLNGINFSSAEVCRHLRLLAPITSQMLKFELPKWLARGGSSLTHSGVCLVLLAGRAWRLQIASRAHGIEQCTSRSLRTLATLLRWPIAFHRVGLQALPSARRFSFLVTRI